MNPFYVGHYTRRLDTRRRLRLPSRWLFGESQSWMILPLEVTEGGKADFASLRLQPVQAHTPARFLETLKIPAAQPPTLDAAIEALRAVAQGRGIDPAVVSQHQTGTRSIHIQLTEAQLAWLGAHDRSLMLLGVASGIRIWASEEYARWERYTSSPAFEKAVRRTLRVP